jgi:hypothetical protein
VRQLAAALISAKLAWPLEGKGSRKFRKQACGSKAAASYRTPFVKDKSKQHIFPVTTKGFLFCRGLSRSTVRSQGLPGSL